MTKAMQKGRTRLQQSGHRQIAKLSAGSQTQLEHRQLSKGIREHRTSGAPLRSISQFEKESAYMRIVPAIHGGMLPEFHVTMLLVERRATMVEVLKKTTGKGAIPHASHFFCLPRAQLRKLRRSFQEGIRDTISSTTPFRSQSAPHSRTVIRTLEPLSSPQTHVALPPRFRIFRSALVSLLLLRNSSL